MRAKLLFRRLRVTFSAILVFGISLTLASPQLAISRCGRDHGGKPRERTRPRGHTGPNVGVALDLSFLFGWIIILLGGGEEVKDPAADEEGDLPYGILLVRDDPKWRPRYGNQTTVTAQIYHKPQNSAHWVPSNAKKVITVRFHERSNEDGQALNKNLPKDPQDSPDIYLPADKNKADSTCTDPQGKKAYLMNQCVTKKAVSQQKFVVASEDYGSFSKMEASCEGCVKLKAPPSPKGVWSWKGGIPATAFEAKGKEHLVTVPKDDNNNQIADSWVFDYTLVKLDPNEDVDGLASGGVPGDGLSAYEEYRGFFMQGEHDRTSILLRDLFVWNKDKLPIQLFIRASGLIVHEIKKNEMSPNWVINFNYGTHNAIHRRQADGTVWELEGPQHGLKLQDKRLRPGAAGASWIGPPGQLPQGVRVDRAKVAMGNLEATVAHELGHAVCLHHHGPNDDKYFEEHIVAYHSGVKAPVTAERPSEFGRVKDPTGKSYSITMRVPTPKVCGRQLPKYFVFGKLKGDVYSGREECIMRYNYVNAYIEKDNKTINCTERVSQKSFCQSKKGVTFNKDNKAAGDASKGNCRSMIRVRDR